jgi:hypothetical protein
MTTVSGAFITHYYTSPCIRQAGANLETLLTGLPDCRSLKILFVNKISTEPDSMQLSLVLVLLLLALLTVLIGEREVRGELRAT